MFSVAGQFCFGNFSFNISSASSKWIKIYRLCKTVEPNGGELLLKASVDRRKRDTKFDSS